MHRSRIKHILFTTGTLLATCHPLAVAAAERWVTVATTDNVVIAVDTRSITVKDGVLRAWEKWDYTIDRPGTYTTGYRAYRSARFLTHYDCRERTSAEMQSVFYDASGEVVGKVTEDPKTTRLTYVVPGLLSETALNFVCKTKATPKKGP